MWRANGSTKKSKKSSKDKLSRAKQFSKPDKPDVSSRIDSPAKKNQSNFPNKGQLKESKRGIIPYKGQVPDKVSIPFSFLALDFF